ncbi:MAG: hypothetical protein KF690_00045 [Bacteroidetes bacterium]|nr:hypothetical protein [Bacteroidota bacterium]
MFRILLFLVICQISSAVSAQDMRVSLQLIGKCPDCEHATLESSIWTIDGINSISYVGNGSTVTIIYNSKLTTKDKLLAELRSTGYRVNAQGEGCCALAEQGKSGVVETYASEDEDEDDPILKDDESLKSIDNVNAEIKSVNFEEAIKSDAAHNIEEGEKELQAVADEAGRAAEEVDAEDRAELDSELDVEFTRLSTEDLDDKD